MDKKEKKGSRRSKRAKRDFLSNEEGVPQLQIDSNALSIDLNIDAFSDEVVMERLQEASQPVFPAQRFDEPSTSSNLSTTTVNPSISSELGVISHDLGDHRPFEISSPSELPQQDMDIVEGCEIEDLSWMGEDEHPEQDSTFVSRFAEEQEDIEEDFRSELFTDELNSDAQLNASDPIYDGSPISVLESIAAILCFVQSEHISGVGLGRLLSLIGLHIPKPNKFFKSTKQLFKLLEDKEDNFQISYFCNLCLKKLVSSSTLCDTCTEGKRKVSYMIHFPLERQVRKLFSRPGFLKDINYKFTRVKKNDKNIEDILDGQAHKNAEMEPEVGTIDLSLSWNSDGLQVFNSSSFSIWPFYLTVNDLPPKKRFYTENMLIGGIWCGMSKPHPNIFLQPIFEDLTVLQNGICISDSLTVRGKLICGTCDAPARAYFLNMKLHSGFFSCHLCLTRGEYSAAIGKVTVFPFEENPQPRTLEQYKQHVKFAVENRVIEKKNNHLLNDVRCCGIKGPTLLSYMVKDLFSSTAIDSMHCVYLGVMRQMLVLWFDVEYRDIKVFPFSAYAHLKVVNERMLKIAPPHFLDRAPETIDKLVHWKASMLRAFLFYFSVCVLSDILKPEYFEHFLLFVKGVSLLNSSSISPDDITLADLLLNQFVQQFETLYGLRHMSHNLHMLKHLSSCVRQLGPLWAISCFFYEDMNGRIAQLIHGTRYAGIQVCINLSIISRLPEMVHNLKNQMVKQYCLELRNKGLALKVTEKISEDVSCVGELSQLSDTDRWILDELHQVVFQPKADCVKLFQRLYKDRILYVSSRYSCGSRESSFVKYSSINSHEFGQIVTFVKLLHDPPEYVAVIHRLQTSLAFQTNVVEISHVHQIHPPHIGVDVVPIEKLITVLFKVPLNDNNNYVIEPLNEFELE